MVKSEIYLKYDGGDAARHAIDAKLYGQSLQGIDRMVSDCLIIISLQRLPKRGERAPLILKAKELEKGSVGTPAVIQEASELLGIGIPILTQIGPEIIGYYVTAVLDHFKGKDDNVALAIREMSEMHRVALEAMSKMSEDVLSKMDAVDQRRHEEQMGMQDLLRTAISGSGGAAVDYVAPIGRSVDTASFVSGERPALITNKEDADAIRDSQALDWLTPANEVLTTDGFKFHTSGLSVENPEKEGFLMAEVNDPVFEKESNPYTIAAQKRAKIEVLARRGYKNGKLARIIILDFVREVDADAA